MEVQIGEMTSTVRVTDEETLLSPQVLEKIVRAVLGRLQEQEGQKRRGESDRRVKNSVSAEDHQPAWR